MRRLALVDVEAAAAAAGKVVREADRPLSRFGRQGEAICSLLKLRESAPQLVRYLDALQALSAPVVTQPKHKHANLHTTQNAKHKALHPYPTPRLSLPPSDLNLDYTLN